MGKSLLNSALKFVLVVCLGAAIRLLYMEWGSFQYNVPDEQPIHFNPDGSLVR